MNAAAFCEALKAMRSNWLTIEQIRQEARSTPNTTRLWIAELVAQGVLHTRTGEKADDRNGFAPAVYAVTKEWGGVA